MHFFFSSYEKNTLFALHIRRLTIFPLRTRRDFSLLTRDTFLLFIQEDTFLLFVRETHTFFYSYEKTHTFFSSYEKTHFLSSYKKTHFFLTKGTYYFSSYKKTHIFDKKEINYKSLKNFCISFSWIYRWKKVSSKSMSEFLLDVKLLLYAFY